MSDLGPAESPEAEAIAERAENAAGGGSTEDALFNLPSEPRARNFSIGEVSREEAIEELIAAGVNRQDIEAVEEQYNSSGGEDQPELTGPLLIALVGGGLGGVPIITKSNLERVIRNVTFGTSEDLRPRPRPDVDDKVRSGQLGTIIGARRATDEAYRDDIDGFLKWFGEVFSSDRKVRRGAQQILAEYGMVRPGQKAGFKVHGIQSGETYGEDSVGYGAALTPEYFIAALVVGESRGVHEEEELGYLENEIANYVLSAWRSGWSQLPTDHSAWDPEGILTPIIKANDSPILDRDPSSPDATIYEVRNPITAFEAADIAAVWGDDVQGLLSMPNLREGVLSRAPGASEMFDGFVYSASRKAAQILFNREITPDALLNVEGRGSGPLVFDERTRFNPETGEQEIIGPTRPAEIVPLSRFIPKDRFGLPTTMDTVIQAMAKGEADKAFSDRPNATVADATLLWDDGLTDAEIRDIQLAAFFSNQYPEGMEPGNIEWGSRDDNTARSLWVGAVEQSALSAARGEKLTPKTVIRKLKDRAKAAQENAIGDAINDIESQAIDMSKFQINLEDPASIVSAAEGIAQALLGRGATAAMKRQLVALVHDGQTQQQMQEIRRQVAQEQRQLEEERNRMLAEMEEAEELLFSAEEEAAFGEGPGQVRADVGSTPGEHPNYATGDVPYGQEAKERLRTLGNPNPTALGDIEDAGATEERTGPDGVGVVGQVGTATGFDSNARMEQWLRQNYAEEIDARKFRQLLSSMPQIFASPVSPREVNPDQQ